MTMNGDLKRWYESQPQDESDFVRVGADGKIDKRLIPLDFDDVVEGYYFEGVFYEDAAHTKPITGERGKAYVDIPTGDIYRWSGTMYVKVGGSTPGHVIQASDTQTVSGFDCPVLTADQVTSAYNYLVAGEAVTIQSADGDLQFRAVMGDATTSRPSILLQYYWLGWVDYQIDVGGSTVTITAHKVPEVSAHQITSVDVGANTIDITIS